MSTFQQFKSAIKEDNIEEIKKIIANGGDVNVRDEGGWAPVHLAAKNGRNNIMQLLITHKADVTVQNKLGRTPLYYAAKEGHGNVITTFVTLGGDVTIAEENGSTPLHWAAYYNLLDAVKALVKAGASTTVKNKHGETPLDEANNGSKYRRGDHDYSAVIEILEKGIVVDDDTSNDNKTSELLSLYKQKGGTIDFRSIKLLLVGPPQVGKTSTKRRLLGEDDREKLCSTGLEIPVEVSLDTTTHIDRGDGATVIGTESTALWKSFSLREMGLVFLQHVQKKIEKLKQQITATQEHINIVKTQEGHTASATPTKSPPPPSNVVPSEPVSHEESDKLVKSLLMDDKWEEVASCMSAHLEHSTTAYVIDTGGQPEFHAILPLLLRGPALYLMFFNLLESLEKCYNIKYTTADGTTLSGTSTYTSSYSTLHTLSQLLNSFAHNRSTGDNLHTSAIAILFATHSDLVPRGTKEFEEADRKLRELFSPDNVNKLYHLLHDPREAGFDSIFVPINNKDNTEIGDVRDFLRKAINVACQKSSEVPTLWLLFHFVLRLKHEKTHTCSLEDCTELAIKCGIEREHVARVLNYIHLNLGTILYFDDIPALSHLVICNPEVLFKCISKLICRVYETTGDRTHEHGEIPTSVFEGMLRKTIEESESPLTVQYTIDLMEHFNIVTLIESRESQLNQLSPCGDGRKYFMPCLLRPDVTVTPHPSLDDVQQHPLVVCFPTRTVPLGLVSALAIKLGSLPQWTFPPRHRYSNRLELEIDGDFIVELLVRHSQLELRCKNGEEGVAVPGHVLHFILQSVKKAITAVMSLLGYKSSKILYLVYCPKGHYSEYNGREYISCEQAGRDCPHRYKAAPQQSQWFSEGDRGATTDDGSVDDKRKVPDEDCGGDRSNKTSAQTSNQSSLSNHSKFKGTAVLQKRPELRHIMHLILPKILPLWRCVGDELLFDNGELQAIQMDTTNGGDAKMFLRAVLVKWSQNLRRPYTWQTLLDVLSSPYIGQANLARDIHIELTGLPPPESCVPSHPLSGQPPPQQHQPASPASQVTPPTISPCTLQPSPQVTPPTVSPSTPSHQQQVSPSTTSTTTPVLAPQQEMEFDGSRLAHVLTQVLQKHSAVLDKTLRQQTLSSFANEMFEAGIITPELRDQPQYKSIEEQFTSMMDYYETQDDFENDCQSFLNALSNRGGPLVRISARISKEWKHNANTQLNINLKF